MKRYRITEIENVTLNGERVKLFAVFKRRGDVYIFIGRMGAPRGVKDGELWRYVRGRNVANNWEVY